MALLSFRGISTPSLKAQGEQRRSSLFNIPRDNPEDVALLDRLAFGKIDLLKHARYLALDRGHIQRLNRSNARKHDWLVVLLHLRGDNRDRGCGRGRRGGLVSEPPMDNGERCGGQDDKA